MPGAKSELERQLEAQGWLPRARSPAEQADVGVNRRVLSSALQRREEALRQEAQREAQLEEVRRAAAQARAAAQGQKQFPWVPVLGWSAGLAVLLVPLIVVLARESRRSEVLAQEQMSNADLTCTAGDVTARNSDNLWTWLTGGSDFRCENWETRDSRKQRERDLAEQRWKAREESRKQN